MSVERAVYKITKDWQGDSLIDETNPNEVYVCLAPVGALTSQPVWDIKRVKITGAITMIRQAINNNQFTKLIADNRATYNYTD